MSNIRKSYRNKIYKRADISIDENGDPIESEGFDWENLFAAQEKALRDNSSVYDFNFENLKKLFDSVYGEDFVNNALQKNYIKNGGQKLVWNDLIKLHDPDVVTVQQYGGKQQVTYEYYKIKDVFDKVFSHDGVIRKLVAYNNAKAKKAYDDRRKKGFPESYEFYYEGDDCSFGGFSYIFTAIIGYMGFQDHDAKERWFVVEDWSVESFKDVDKYDSESGDEVEVTDDDKRALKDFINSSSKIGDEIVKEIGKPEKHYDDY